jgi:hypothetical protein
MNTQSTKKPTLKPVTSPQPRSLFRGNTLIFLAVFFIVGVVVGLFIPAKQGPIGLPGESITSAIINQSGHLILTFSDGKLIDTGSAVGQTGQTGTGMAGLSTTSAMVDSNGHLILIFSNGQKVDAGYVIGARGTTGEAGAPGLGVTSVAINTSGHLILTWADGHSTDSGYVIGAKGDKGESGYNEYLSAVRYISSFSVTRGVAYTLYGSGFANVVQISLKDSSSNEVMLTTIDTTASFGNFNIAITIPSDAVKGLGSVKAYINGEQVATTPIIIQ